MRVRLSFHFASFLQRVPKAEIAAEVNPAAERAAANAAVRSLLGFRSFILGIAHACAQVRCSRMRSRRRNPSPRQAL